MIRRALALALLLAGIGSPLLPQVAGISAGAFGDKHWKPPVADVAHLPTTGNGVADTRRVLDSGEEYWWNGTIWVDAGVQGPAGASGSVWTTGSGVPSGGADGDFYLRSTGAVYQRTSGTWSVVANLAGPQGATGATGPQGATGPTGATGAAGSTGTAGANGADGKTLRSGSDAPSSGLGVDGDFYIDTSAKAIYGPKSAGAWGAGTSLIGPQGPKGDPGDSGSASDYDPDVVPLTGMDVASDEFTSSIGAQWRWANQGSSATDTATLGTAVMQVPVNDGDTLRVRWITVPTAVDLGVCVKMGIFVATGINSVGVTALYGGSESTPTEFQRIFFYAISGGDPALHVYQGPVADYNRTNDRQDADNRLSGSPQGAPHVAYVGFQYVQSTRAWSGQWSPDGRLWRPLATVTLPSDLTSVGRMISARSGDSGTAADYYFFRVFTAAAGASAEQLTGRRCGK